MVSVNLKGMGTTETDIAVATTNPASNDNEQPGGSHTRDDVSINEANETDLSYTDNNEAVESGVYFVFNGSIFAQLLDFHTHFLLVVLPTTTSKKFNPTVSTYIDLSVVFLPI